MNQPIRCYYKENGKLHRVDARSDLGYEGGIAAVKNLLKHELVDYAIRRRVLAVVNE